MTIRCIIQIPIIALGFFLLLVSVKGQSLTIHQAVEIEVPTEKGRSYQIQASADLQTWVSLGDPFRGTGEIETKSLRAQSSGQFFRSVQISLPPSEMEDVIFQHSTLGALLLGIYEGDLSFDRLLERGNFGLGTFQGVDGELVVLDGEAYRIRVDGMVSTVTPQTQTPFAVVTHFESDLVFELTGIDSMESLGVAIDERLPSKNLLYAIKVTGIYDELTTRSVPAQERPYPPLVDVVANQTTFDLAGNSGTMVGFRLPAYLSALNATGYHFHFVNDARTQGGHVLELGAAKLRVEVDVCQGLEMSLPENEDFLLAPFE